MAKRLIPTPHEILGEAKSSLVDSRPSSKKWLDKGNWSNILSGWKHQATVCLNRLYDEVVCSSLMYSTDNQLLELVDSEYTTSSMVTSTQKSIGTLVLCKTVTTSSMDDIPVIYIKQGTRFKIKKDLTPPLPTTSVLYESVEPSFSTSGMIIQEGDVYKLRFFVKIRAINNGSDSNIIQKYYPLVLDISGDQEFCPIEISDKLDDTELTIVHAECSGGRTYLFTSYIREYAEKSFNGIKGANNSAIELAAMSTNGVKNIAISDDTTTGNLLLWVTDDSYAYSSELSKAAIKTIYNTSDPFVGFGCKVVECPVQCVPININISVLLRKSEYIAYSESLSYSIKSSLIDYFEKSDNWWSWSIKGIFGSVLKADRMIMSVKTSITNPSGYDIVVRDNNSNILEEPSIELPIATEIDPTPLLTHYLSIASNINISFYPPS